jgi:hypothetical protein
MYNNRMTSFRSTNYPQRRSIFLVTQEYAMRYYMVLLMFVMVGVMLQINAQKNPVYLGVGGSIASILLGNLLAHVKLRRSIAEIFFLNDGFSIISVYDILHQSPKRSFPLRFANPTRTEDQIQFHFEDQIMHLKREDWGDEFDLIWSWFISGSADYGAVIGEEEL